MKTFQATTNIKASADKIWQILTNASGYPQWDPWAIRIEGKIAAGEKITAYTKLSPDRAFPVKVTTFEPGRKMVWTGGMPLGLFKGIREFILAPKGDGTVDFTVREQFSGPMLPLIGRTLPDMTTPFQDFVNGLKAKAEGS
jgi:hypothetical protein